MAIFSAMAWERWVEAIASVLAQGLDVDALIIVDDGSSDATGAIVRSFADGRIRLAANDGCGVSAQRVAVAGAARRGADQDVPLRHRAQRLCGEHESLVGAQLVGEELVFAADEDLLHGTKLALVRTRNGRSAPLGIHPRI